MAEARLQRPRPSCGYRRAGQPRTVAIQRSGRRAAEYLRGASGAIDELRHEKVRGIDTTHYRATIDINKAAAAAPDTARAAIKQISETFGIVRVPVDAWIDDDGRARRISETIDYSRAKSSPTLPANSLPKRVQVTLEYYDFGTPVTAPVPPSDQVADFGDLLAQLRAGSGTETPATGLLAGRLVTDVPPGYLRQVDSVGDTGPSDLEKAVRDDGEPDARSVLVADGFVAGYQRLWAKGDDAKIIDFVYEFRARWGCPLPVACNRRRARIRAQGSPPSMCRAFPGLGDSEVCPTGPPWPSSTSPGDRSSPRLS